MDQKSNDLMSRIRGSESLPSLSAVAMEVLKLTNDETISIKDLALVIEKDPALALKILRLVNSSFFGIPRGVGTIHRAVVTLGIRTTKVLALGFSLTSAVGSCNGKGFDYRRYWRRSIIHAVTSRLLARTVLPRLADEAFTAGLLADVGSVAVWQCAREAYERLLASSTDSTEPLHDVEERVWGVSHARIAEDLLEHWSLPEPLCRAVGAHHGEGLNALTGEALDLAKIVLAAAAVAGFLCNDPPASELDTIRERLNANLGLSADQTAGIFNELEARVAETASLLAVDIDTTIQSMIQSQATLRMAQLSQKMESECSDLARRETAARERETTAREREGRLIEEQKALIHAASVDSLTGLFNRAVFDRELKLCITRAARSKNHAVLLILDVDHFKKINDTFGHPAGDCVLRGVAKVLSGTLRSVDIAVRYGGEEFAVVNDLENPAGAIVLAERIRKAVGSEVFSHHGQSISVTVSIGVALWEGSARTVSEALMVETADKALYAAKREGRNRVRVLSVGRC